MKEVQKMMKAARITIQPEDDQQTRMYKMELAKQQKEIDDMRKCIIAMKRETRDKFIIAAFQALINRVPYEKDFTDNVMIDIVDLSYDFGDMMMAIKYEEQE